MQNGLHVPQNEHYGNSVIAPSATRAIADAYDALPDFDHRAVPAFKAMAEETGRQYDFMTKPRSKGGMGIDVEVTKEDPYGKHSVWDIVNEVRHDVNENGRIKVLSTASTGGHAIFTNDQNDMFRAVHDVFGHLGSGRGVDRHGEEAAYQKHSQMFSPLARQAMATETRGQNSALHKHGDFQDQKIAILPAHMQSLQFSRRAPVSELLQATEHARGENAKQGL
jgi:hypothetical protein